MLMHISNSRPLSNSNHKDMTGGDAGRRVSRWVVSRDLEKALAEGL
jgi:hypothetical protein